MGLTGNDQYLRVANIKVFNAKGDGLDFTGLRTKFVIEKTSESTPNKAKIEIYNLKESSRTFLEAKEMRVILEVGYPKKIEGVASGNITKAFSRQEVPNWITTIESQDGQTELTENHIEESWSPGTPFQAMIAKGIEKLGLAKGPQVQAIAGAAAEGFSFSGTAKDMLDSFAQKFGFEWSVQDGAVQILPDKIPIPGVATVVSATSGLINNVVKTEKGIEFSNLINGGIAPGKLIKVESIGVRGFYKVRKATLTGDTHGDEWFVMAEAEPI